MSSPDWRPAPPVPTPRSRTFTRLPLRPQLMLLALVAIAPFMVLVLANVGELSDREDAAVRARIGVMARTAGERVNDHLRQVDAVLLVLGRTLSTRAADAARNDTLLRSIKRMLPPFYNDIAIWAPNGDNIGSSRDCAAKSRSNVADRRYFRDALRVRRLAFGDPAISRSTGQWTVGMARPVLASDGSVVAVVSATTRLTRLGDMLSATELPQGSVVTLLDEQGRVLARTLAANRWLGMDVAATPLFNAIRNHAETAEIAGVDGVPRLTAFAPTRDVPWTVAVGVPPEAAYAPVRAALARNLSLAALALIAALLLAAALGGRTAKPIATLTADANAFGGGMLSRRTAVDGTDEIGMLGRAFNEMARTVEQRTAAVLTSEARARRLIDSNLIGIVVTDARGAILEANDVFLAIVGHTREELAAGVLRRDALTPAEFRPMDAWAQLQLEQTGSAPPWEQEYLRADGTRVRVLVGIAQLPGAERQYASFVLDLTQRIAAETALRDTHDTLRALVDGAPMAIFSTDAAGLVETWNPPAERLFGWRAEELRGKHFPLRSVGGDRGLLGALDRALTGEPVADLEARIARRDGSLLDVSVAAAPLRDVDGAVRGAVAFVTDIAARKRVERALAEREEQYRLVTDGIPLMIAYIDRTERYRFVNAAFEGFVGRSRDEILGRHVREVIGEGGYDEIRPHVADALAGLPSRFDVAVPDSAGGRRLEVTYIPHATEAGHADGFFSIAADVTTRQALEQQHHRVQSLEAVGQLAAGIAHDFNDALTAINRCSDLLRGRIEEAGGDDVDLAEIDAAARRIAALVRHLLSVGGLQTAQPVVGPLNEIVAAVEPALRHALGSAVSLTMTLAGDAGDCYVDPARVQQVLIDLALHARESMPEGGAIELATRASVVDGRGAHRHPGLAAGTYAVVIFADSRSRAPSLPELRAFAAPRGPSEDDAPAALRLANAYGIVRQLGGQIYVDADAGAAAHFEVWFPRVPSASPGKTSAGTLVG